MKLTHVTLVLLYCSTAGMYRKDAYPTWVMEIFGVFRSNNRVPLTIQTITPVVTLQLKVAVDPSVALTDEGVETNAAVFHDNKYIASTKVPAFTLKFFKISNSLIVHCRAFHWRATYCRSIQKCTSMSTIVVARSAV